VSAWSMPPFSRWRAMLSLPAVAASLLAGAACSVVQTVTQVQDSSLTLVPKLLASLAALFLAGPWIGAQLTRFTQHLLLAIAGVNG
jgi:flagellar biosynthesis protein FliQ